MNNDNFSVKTGRPEAIQYKHVEIMEALDIDLCKSHSCKSNYPKCHRRAYQEINHSNFRAVFDYFATKKV